MSLRARVPVAALLGALLASACTEPPPFTSPTKRRDGGVVTGDMTIDPTAGCGGPTDSCCAGKVCDNTGLVCNTQDKCCGQAGYGCNAGPECCGGLTCTQGRCCTPIG